MRLGHHTRFKSALDGFAHPTLVSVTVLAQYRRNSGMKRQMTQRNIISQSHVPVATAS